jgi:hypothetical protein
MSEARTQKQLDTEAEEVGNIVIGTNDITHPVHDVQKQLSSSSVTSHHCIEINE